MMKSLIFKRGKIPKLTDEQKNMLREAKKFPIVYDEDCPKQTDEQLKQFKRVNPMVRELAR